MMQVSQNKNFSTVLTYTLIETSREILPQSIFHQCLKAAGLERFAFQRSQLWQPAYLTSPESSLSVSSQGRVSTVRNLTIEEAGLLARAIHSLLGMPIYRMLLHYQGSRLAHNIIALSTTRGWINNFQRVQLLQIEPNYRLPMAIELVQRTFSEMVSLMTFEASGENTIILNVEPCFNCFYLHEVGYPVCEIITQLTLEILRWFTERPLYGYEIECIASGGKACLHQIQQIQSLSLPKAS